MAATYEKRDKKDESYPDGCKDNENPVYASATLLNTGEMVCLYLLIIFLSVILRYLLLPSILHKVIYEEYLTNIAIAASAGLSLLGLAILKPCLLHTLSFGISFRYICVSIIAGVLGANLSLFISSFYLPVHHTQIALAPLILTVVIAPPIEELLFRGIFFESISRKYSLFVSVLVCSVGFASFHVLFWPGLVGGVLLTSVYIASQRSLSASILTHAVANLALNSPKDTLLYIHYHFH